MGVQLWMILAAAVLHVAVLPGDTVPAGEQPPWILRLVRRARDADRAGPELNIGEHERLSRQMRSVMYDHNWNKATDEGTTPTTTPPETPPPATAVATTAAAPTTEVTTTTQALPTTITATTTTTETTTATEATTTTTLAVPIFPIECEWWRNNGWGRHRDVFTGRREHPLSGKHPIFTI